MVIFKSCMMTANRTAKKAIPIHILNPFENKRLKVFSGWLLPFPGFPLLLQSKISVTDDPLYHGKMPIQEWEQAFSLWSSTQPFPPLLNQIRLRRTEVENNYRNSGSVSTKNLLSAQGKSPSFSDKMLRD